ncbi:protealysin inhibitor emfourin [Pontibacter silvestris]|uniref:Protealysin inhibitor emfourin n=1 Tax=Pontibacter silvestris TaxID=2305183 RepID=A0ABW4WY03_9BACT|nr:protealysin inhibitor emfourin [Pontibacter silvestris]MCC9135253.1 hypothetical protein [Pontibacter silvestris]
MKIYFKPEGGFGFFPGLNKALEINCESLPADEASHVENLVCEANFFDLPEPAPVPVRGADMKEYIIKVEDKGRQHMVKLTDLETNQYLRDLLTYLTNKQKETRSGS